MNSDGTFFELEEEAVDPFAQYYKLGEPSRAEKVFAWQTAIGLQDVDKLKNSDYLIHAAMEHIDGSLSIDGVRKLIDNYYEENVRHLPERTEEADKVAVKIAEILSENSFVFSPVQYLSIHQRLFEGVYPHAGKIRDYNISKKEWVLNGKSVTYAGATELRQTLEYDFQMERSFDYTGLSMSEIIRHLAKFVAGLWQIHIFGEGNTRTTAVFFIKYIRTLGFSANNDIFAKHSWYFRNALVRANYADVGNNIHEDRRYLELFLRNLLMGEQNELKNRYLHIEWEKHAKTAHWGVETALSEAQTALSEVETAHWGIETAYSQVKTAHSRAETALWGSETAHSDTLSIETLDSEKLEKIKILSKETNVSAKTTANIIKLYHAFRNEKIFGRSDVMETLQLSDNASTTLLKKMYQLRFTEKMTGMGKGKYRFVV